MLLVFYSFKDFMQFLNHCNLFIRHKYKLKIFRLHLQLGFVLHKTRFYCIYINNTYFKNVPLKKKSNWSPQIKV